MIFKKAVKPKHTILYIKFKGDMEREQCTNVYTS